MTNAANPAGSFSLTDVSIVDTRDGTITSGLDIGIEAGRIADIHQTGSPAPAGRQVIEAAGRYVVPGFVDMHAHPLNRARPEPILRLMLTYGVTGFRQMSGTDDLLRRRTAGRLTLPADGAELLTTCGPLLTPMNAGTPDAAVAEIRRQSDLGADFLKVVGVSPATFAAAQGEAGRRGLRIACHLPTGVDVRAASRAGIGSIEHLGPGVAIPAECSADGSAIRAGLRGRSLPLPTVRLPFGDAIAARLLARLVVNPAQLTRAAGFTAMQRSIDSFDEELAYDLAAQFVADGTWHCPTLIRIKTQQLCDAEEFRNDPDLRFVSRRTHRTWATTARRFGRFTEAQRATFSALYDLQKRLVGIFDRAGVSMVAGSDAVGAVWVVAGPSLHREFDELTASGLSPLRVLQSATLDPARYLGIEDAGRIATGHRADLVLLEQNPLDDPRHLHGVAGVVHGRHYASGVELRRTRDDLAVVGVD